MRFRTTVVLGGRTATGLQVPDEVVEALGAGKRPPVRVTVADYSYRTTVAPMGGAYWVPLAAEHREAAGVRADEEVDVDIELDHAPREVTVPDDLAAAFDNETRARFDALAYTHRREWVRWVEEAKKPETRATRIQRTVESIRAGQRVR
ncbi:YdeI/OmpD-associated family protein [Geodermatophilus sp. YIM 151500]|uniref:YdeI/OmpD-associated family protein n=1 Tax=Geodermatophilus sp. YIM 151500 TaxID=2984531 RepID=UPI0021E3ADE8|nr:YdeI/OmpD-associated family protein [Geodermatophilus sp. YIM 151500]MCV2490566.1 YdeI/OmpD-associated family protein [Geodermatophilus sp. YIM 151500]